MSTRRTWSASRCSRVRRARCSAPAPQAGVLRYITNKPKLDVTEGDVNAGYSYTAHGDPNSNVDATINLPLIPDTLAVRGGDLQRQPRRLHQQCAEHLHPRRAPTMGIADGNGGVVPTDSVVDQQQQYRRPMPSTRSPTRASACRGSTRSTTTGTCCSRRATRTWMRRACSTRCPTARRVTFTPAACRSAAAAAAAVGDAVQSVLRQGQVREHRADGHRQDRRPQSSSTRRLPGAQRRPDAGLHQLRARRVRLLLSMRRATPRASAAAGKCYSPSATWQDTEKNTHQSHELRLSTPDDWRLRGHRRPLLGGLQDLRRHQLDVQEVPTCTPGGLQSGCFLPIQPWPDDPTNNPGLQPQDGFFDDFDRTFIQHAAYTSISFDVVPEN